MNRKDFPILKEKINGNPLIYLDSAATTQKPKPVIKAISTYYLECNANVHRGVHTLSERATLAYEKTREKVRKFINAQDSSEIIFVRGTTEAINLVSQSYGRERLKRDDEIIISAMEHHSNIVPWQLLCAQVNARLRVIEINQSGEMILDSYKNLLNEKTKFVSLSHVSNALGTVNPVKEMIRMAHELNVPVMIDGAQAAPHISVDVQDLDCDFYAFSGHKIYAPMGIGVLYGKKYLLQSMPPYQGGGEMISHVTFEETTYNKLPHKFEAGTPNVASVVGLGAAIDYLNALDMNKIAQEEQKLLYYATEVLQTIPGLRIVGNAKEKIGVISFEMDNIHAHDVGTILDNQGIAVRAGHHCAMPVMNFFGVSATVRVSLGLYNEKKDIDALVRGLLKVKELFGNV